MKTKVAVTAEVDSSGQPVWGVNQNVTEYPYGSADVAIENLIAGRRYWVKVWNEDDYGNKSPEIVRPIDTAQPDRVVPLTFSANGYFDSGSPMRAYVKLPSDVKDVISARVSLALRQFMAPSQAAAAIASQTSNNDGGSTTVAGGAATTVAGGGTTTASGGGSTTGNPGPILTGGGTLHTHVMGTGGTTAGSFTSRQYTSGGPNFNMSAATAADLVTAGESVHQHSLPGHSHTTPNHTHDAPNHTHDTPAHSHDTPAHQHGIPGHGHSLVYGTFEEAYPATTNIQYSLFSRNGMTTSWTLLHTGTGFVNLDMIDLDLINWITGSGDYRLEIISAAGQPNGGRLGCDLYGALEVVLG